MTIVNSQPIDRFENSIFSDGSCKLEDYFFRAINPNDIQSFTKHNNATTFSLNEANNCKGYDPETLYFEDFDSTYRNEQKCEIKITSDNIVTDYFTFVLDESPDNNDNDSSSDDEISIFSYESDESISSFSPFPIENYSLGSVHMTPETYRDFLINYHKLKISQAQSNLGITCSVY
ncbi:9931_t:CDS:1 [Ambispora gerdemannii]|uniref:9931_t:CDS:1 n=1 Tax=Ambispora gerdemannii TaxID=144530 RepID=A0A9N9F616_9GLOM|nr:9931_t:CDS:1 [Ambispora gerdemannii]